MKIIILTPTLMPHDAIGNDVRHQCKAINQKVESKIYTQNYHKDEFEDFIISKDDLNEIIKQKENIIIYHHGVLWEEGQEILKNAKCRIFLKYHNITHKEFFEPYNVAYTDMCFRGRLQTKAIVDLDKVEKYICDSIYNSQEILELGVSKDKVTILAPFHKLDDFLDVPEDKTLIKELSKTKINLLFVGRFAPNKGHRDMVEVINNYVTYYGRDIMLNIVGGQDAGLNNYISEIKQLISDYDLEDVITIHDKISFPQLHTYYKYSDYFLLLSGHEGFCVPILEAQMHKLPLIALDTTAVAETLGKNQLIFKELNLDKFSASIKILDENSSYKEYLVKNGTINFNKYTNQILEQQLLTHIG